MNKASGGDGIPVELFQILKDDAVKVMHSICQQFGKLSSGHSTEKGQFSFQSQRKTMPKNAQTTAQLHSSCSESKASAGNAGDLDSIPGSERSPGEGIGNPLQHCCLEKPMDRNVAGDSSWGHRVGPFACY